jgi:hypothetical protein
MKKRDQKQKGKNKHSSNGISKSSSKDAEVDSWRGNSAEGTPPKHRQDLLLDFLSFTDAKDYTVQNGNTASKNEEDLESRVAREFNSNANYPWLTKQSLRVKDIFLFFHSEIIDFVNYISPTPQDNQVRQAVIDRV